MRQVRIYEREHYKEFEFGVGVGSRRFRKELQCKYCEYTSKREDFMLKHLSKKHPTDKERILY